MTGITSLSQFLNSSSSQSGASSSMFTSTTKTATTPTKTTTTSSTADGDTITLSAAAQALLDKAASTMSSSSSSTKKDFGFTLTAKQQEQLQSVLDKYKDKPQTQANYDAIQKDLKKYRLDTVNMGAKESVKSFSLKGMMFAIMSGKDVSSGTADRAQALAQKKSAYAIQIVADWATTRAAATKDGEMSADV